MDAPNKFRRRPMVGVIEIVPGCVVIKKEDTIILNVFSKEIELNVLQAVALRNYLSQWANAKRTRDQRNADK